MVAEGGRRVPLHNRHCRRKGRSRQWWGGTATSGWIAGGYRRSPWGSMEAKEGGGGGGGVFGRDPVDPADAHSRKCFAATARGTAQWVQRRVSTFRCIGPESKVHDLGKVAHEICEGRNAGPSRARTSPRPKYHFARESYTRTSNSGDHIDVLEKEMELSESMRPTTSLAVLLSSSPKRLHRAPGQVTGRTAAGGNVASERTQVIGTAYKFTLAVVLTAYDAPSL